jgi:hypothetical protein
LQVAQAGDRFSANRLIKLVLFAFSGRRAELGAKLLRNRPRFTGAEPSASLKPLNSRA